jgi:hypothetical protein
MRKILVTTLAALALAATLRAADDNNSAVVGPRGGNDRLLLEPPSPFERPRSLFEFDPRPTRRPIMPLYPTVERELDRGTGRIETDTELELRLRQREQDERRGLLPERRASERFAERRDRDWRLEQQARRAAREGESQDRLETESQRLAAERERFYRSAGIDAGGAAHDTRQLKDLERAYQRDVKQLKKERSAELKRIEKDDALKGDARRAARIEIDVRFRAAQAERRERYAKERAQVLGTE